MPQGKMTATDDDIIEWMQTDGDPAYVTREVAEAFGMEPDAMRPRLNDLADVGRLVRKKGQ